MRRRPPQFTFEQIRTYSLWALGIGIGVYETLVDQVAQPALLIFAAGLLGTPYFVGRDEKKEKPPDVPAPDVSRPPNGAG